MNFALNQTTIWLLGLSVLFILNFVLVIVLFAKHASLRRKVKHWQNIHATADLEEVYAKTLRRVEDTDEALSDLAANVKALELALRKKVGTPRVKRYNAFADTGSDLSFSVALLDESNTGIVLSSIYGREESRTYGKPVYEGQSTYPLTSEEVEVLTASGPEHKPVREPV